VEFPALVVGEESPFAVHVTRFDTYKPLPAGQVSLLLSGGDAPEERFCVSAPQVPGIFRPIATPARATTRTLTILIEGDGILDRHDLGPVTVFPDRAAAASATPEDAPNGATTITFLKEQQVCSPSRSRSFPPCLCSTCSGRR
jgi:hypothetical protein